MKLPPCPNSPNCVSSQAPQSNSHYISPFKIRLPYEVAWAGIKNIIQNQPRMVIIRETNEFIDVEVTSLIFRFIDDVKIVYENPTGIIHIRSASRIGHGDLGVNRRRVEKLRTLFKNEGFID